MLIVYNRTHESHDEKENNFYIGRGSVLGNPYSNIKDGLTKAIYYSSDPIKEYDSYFDLMYGSNLLFTDVVDHIYHHYKNGEDVYLECYCKPKPCHGDIIVEKLRCRLIKEKVANILTNKKLRVNYENREKKMERVL